MTAKTEQQLENELIEQTVENGYERATIPHVEALQDNFRIQMQKLNEDNLKSNPLTDKEFERLLLIIEGKHGKNKKEVEVFRWEISYLRDGWGNR